MKTKSFIRLVFIFFLFLFMMGCRNPDSSDSDPDPIPPTPGPTGMIKVAAGSFTMGNGDSSYTGTRELPVHTVNLDSFYIAAAEVTAADYKKCVDAGSCTYNIQPTETLQTYNEEGKENHPINYMTWDDTQNYITWLNSQNSGSYRLCTEAEWEYAARASSTTIYPCGDESACLDKIAWYVENSEDSTHPVKSKSPNAWGIYDMIGNVYEWVQDAGHLTYDGAPTDGSSWEADGNGEHMYRGGFFKTTADSARVSRRLDRNDTGFSMGFRLCAGSIADTAPVVFSTNPADDAQDVAITSTISITFNEPIDTTTVTTNTANTTCSGSIQVSTDDFSTCVQMNADPVSSNNDRTFTLTPAANLAYDTTHDIRVTTAIADINGNNLESQYTTGTGFVTSEQDLTPPTVSVTDPANNATSVAPNTTISVTFSEAMNTSTITTNTTNTVCSGSIQVSTDGFLTCIQMNADPVSSNGDKTFTVTPAALLASDTSHDIKVTTDVTDMSANALAAEFTMANGFRTASDTTAPTIVSIQPGDTSTDIPINTTIVVTFDESMDTSTVTDITADTTCSGSIQVSVDDFGTCIQMDALPVASNNDRTFTLTPTANLTAGSTYKVKILTDVTDVVGNALSSVYTTATGFTTGSYTAPKVTSTTPEDDSSNIAVNSSMAVTFSEAIDPSTVTTNTTDTACSGTFQVSTDDFTTCVQMSAVPSSSNGDTTFTVTPAAELVFNKLVKIKITAGVQNPSGTPLLGNTDFVLSNGYMTRAMVLIPDGSFTMGSPDSDASADTDEKPEHTVTISSFYIYDHEVTATEYKDCVDAGGCTYTGSTTGVRRTYDMAGRENHPINYINWDTAQEFVTWMNSTSNHTYRLCSEAEWEYAARAGSTTLFPCGDDESCLSDIAWYSANSNDSSQNVKTKSANAWGLYDMIGNAYEWVQDYYHTDYTSAPTDGSAWEDPTSDTRVYRGGYWRNSAENMRSGFRASRAPDTAGYSNGFRFCADYTP